MMAGMNAGMMGGFRGAPGQRPRFGGRGRPSVIDSAPSNSYGPPPGIPPGGGIGSPGPIDTGPSMMPPSTMPPSPYMSGGGFTGGQMPPNMGGMGGIAPPMPIPPQGQPWIGGGPTYMEPPQANIPNMGGGMGGGMMGGLRNAYGRSRF